MLINYCKDSKVTKTHPWMLSSSIGCGKWTSNISYFENQVRQVVYMTPHLKNKCNENHLFDQLEIHLFFIEKLMHGFLENYERGLMVPLKEYLVMLHPRIKKL